VAVSEASAVTATAAAVTEVVAGLATGAA
jgi:hypothetical protein